MKLIDNELTDLEVKIINAANKVILQYGIDGATMGQIAEEAGISRTSLNYYYRSKQQLIRNIINSLENKIIPTVSRLINNDSLTFKNKIDLFIDEYIDLITKYPMIPNFVLAEIRRNPQWVILFFKKGNINFEKLIEQLNKEISQGNIIPFQIEDLFANVIGLCVFPILAQPLMMEFFFDNKEKHFAQFMVARKDEVKRIIHNWLKPD